MERKLKFYLSNIFKQNQCQHLFKVRKYFYISCLLFSFSIFSSHEEHCELSMPWKLPVCAQTTEEISDKSNVLSQQLAESLKRKKVIPEQVIESSKTVFRIGTQNTFRGWSWNFEGGSGFFMFDNRTFLSAYHVLEFFKENISHWREVVFKDQNGNQHDFKIKGVRFASKVHDMVVFEIEGYDGPILEPSERPPQEQSYVIGYNQDDVQIQSFTHPFDATNIHYGLFIELFDCYYGFNFNGFSGGPLVNKTGKVEGVFSNSVNSPLSVNCGFSMARKVNSLTEEIKTSVMYHSFEQFKKFMQEEEVKAITLAEMGDMNAKITISELLTTDSSRILTSDNALAQHLLMLTIIMNYKMEALSDNLMQESEDPIINIVTKSLKDENSIQSLLLSLADDIMTASKPHQLLSVTWYERGVAAYSIDGDLETACQFWDKARQTNHPYVLSDFVMIPDMDIVRCR